MGSALMKPWLGNVHNQTVKYVKLAGFFVMNVVMIELFTQWVVKITVFVIMKS